jgi:hypothetical protein
VTKAEKHRDAAAPGTVRELKYRACLPDPGLADQHCHGAVAANSAVEQRIQLGQLSLTADEGGRGASGGMLNRHGCGQDATSLRTALKNQVIPAAVAYRIVKYDDTRCRLARRLRKARFDPE